jgi:hypothetical protein
MSRLFWVICSACLLGTGCFQDSTPQHSSFLPLDYQTNPSTPFPIVRSCRLNVKHDNQYQLVRANSIAADPITNGSYPLPVGSVVVAEEHGNDPSCNNLVGFKLKAKENSGYDSAAGDWHWQELDANQRILQDGKLTTCSSCHAQCTDFFCSSH